MQKYQYKVMVLSVTLLIGYVLVGCNGEPEHKKVIEQPKTHHPEATTYEKKDEHNHAVYNKVASNQMPGVTAASKVIDLGVEPSMITDEIKQGDQPNNEIMLLPDMFDGDKNTEKKAVSIGLLIDEESENLDDSVNGAEISFELQTN